MRRRGGVIRGVTAFIARGARLLQGAALVFVGAAPRARLVGGAQALSRAGRGSYRGAALGFVDMMDDLPT